jgi:hypothetical protein
MVTAAITVYFGSITPHSGANKKQRKPDKTKKPQFLVEI